MITFDKDWTLFLDRDGVINQRIPGSYIMHPEAFTWAEGSLEALEILSGLFDRILVVTNQQGIGKGLMDERQLAAVHGFMLEELKKEGGRIDKVYFCPELAHKDPLCRKPNPGMALEAKKDFPGIIFSKSIMVGDSMSDMLFGEKLGMTTVFIESNPDEVKRAEDYSIDFRFTNLLKFANLCVIPKKNTST